MLKSGSVAQVHSSWSVILTDHESSGGVRREGDDTIRVYRALQGSGDTVRSFPGGAEEETRKELTEFLLKEKPWGRKEFVPCL